MVFVFTTHESFIRSRSTTHYRSADRNCIVMRRRRPHRNGNRSSVGVYIDRGSERATTTTRWRRLHGEVTYIVVPPPRVDSRMARPATVATHRGQRDRYRRWCCCCCCCYCGTALLRCKGRTVVRTEKWGGMKCEASVNGKVIGALGWRVSEHRLTVLFLHPVSLHEMRSRPVVGGPAGRTDGRRWLQRVCIIGIALHGHAMEDYWWSHCK